MPSPSWDVTTESVGALTDSLLDSGPRSLCGGELY
jgi:hypothetical protein